MSKTAVSGANSVAPLSPESRHAQSKLHSKHIIKTLGKIIKIMTLKRKIVETKQTQPYSQGRPRQGCCWHAQRNLISMNFIVRVTGAWITLLRLFSSFWYHRFREHGIKELKRFTNSIKQEPPGPRYSTELSQELLSAYKSKVHWIPGGSEAINHGWSETMAVTFSFSLLRDYLTRDWEMNFPTQKQEFRVV